MDGKKEGIVGRGKQEGSSLLCGYGTNTPAHLPRSLGDRLGDHEFKSPSIKGLGKYWSVNDR